MTERPILFNAEMVQAILNGNKTQTRRVVKGNESYKDWSIATRVVDSEYLKQQLPGANESSFVLQEQEGELVDCKWQPISCPYGKIGDQLWVKETWRTWASLDHVKPSELGDGCLIEYKAGGNSINAPKVYDMSKKWRTSLFMPKRFSRLHLEIVNVRIERLNNIKHKDAIAEGVERCENIINGKSQGTRYQDYQLKTDDVCEWFTSPINSFETLWESINGAGLWAANPWVWVVEFKTL